MPYSLEKTRTILNITVVLIGLVGTLAAFFGGFVITPAEAEESHIQLKAHLHKHDEKFKEYDKRLISIELAGYKTQYYLLVDKENITERQKLELEIVKNKILNLESVIAGE